MTFEFVIKDDDRMEVLGIGGSVRDLKGALPKPRRALSLLEMDDIIAKCARGTRR